jgi:hypothetical protein
VVQVGQGEWWAEFKLSEGRDGRYYRIIAQSGHPYESKYRCEQDVNWLRANAGLIMVHDHTGRRTG